MKKVKIMLMATLVVAGVGGALAFKANNKFGVGLYCGTTITSCSEYTNKFITAPGRPIPDVYCSTQPSTYCPIMVDLDD